MQQNVLAEYEALTQGCGLLVHEAHSFTELAGPGAAEFLQGQITNDIEGRAPGEGVYAVLLTPKGRIRMDMRALRTEAGVAIDFAPDRAEILGQTIQKFRIGYRFDITDLSGDLRLFALIGPDAGRIVSGVDPEEHSHRILRLAGTDVRAVRTHWGIDLFVPAAGASDVKGMLIDSGAVIVGWDAAEIRRVEAGRPRLGFEFDDDEIPQEVRLNDLAVSFEKGCYVGQETVARLFYKGKPNRLLQGLRLDAAVSRGGAVFDGDRQVGEIGTAVESPVHGALALALLRHEINPGDAVTVGDAAVAATVVEPAELVAS